MVMVMLHFGWLLGGEDFWGRCDPYIAERAGAVTPRPLVVVVCFTSFRLPELEVSGYRGVVRRGHR